MMKRINKALIILLTFIMLVCIMPFGCMPAYAYTNHTQEEAVNWIIARGNEAWWEDVDKRYGCQCVDLVMKYYQYLVGYNAGGNAYEYITNTLPTGWWRDHSPSAGAIFVCPGNEWNGVWTTDSFGHVGLVYEVSGNTVKTVETNTADPCDGGSNSYARFKSRKFASNVWYIHPFNNHTHSYSSAITKQPNCAETGVRTYTCSCGSTYTETIAATGHIWDEGTVVTDAKCGSEGLKKYICTECSAEKTEIISATGHTPEIDEAVLPTCTDTGLTEGSHCSKCTAVIKSQEIIPALGHDFCLIDIEAICDSVSGTYKCSRCNEEKTEYSNEYIVTDWSEEKPVNVPQKDIESKMQYRKSVKCVEWSEEAELEGYKATGKTDVEYGEYGSWSNYTLGTAVKTDTLDVETHNLYRYYAFVCPVQNCGKRDPLQGACSHCGYTLTGENAEIIWSPVAYSESNPTDIKGVSYKKSTTSLGDGKRWFFSTGNYYDTAAGTYDTDSSAIVISEGYRYRERSKTVYYQYYKWSDYGDWQDEAIAVDEDTQVETRTLYRYTVYPLGHSYNNDWEHNEVGHWHKCNNCICTSEIKDHIYDDTNDLLCNICGYKREIVPVLKFKTAAVSLDTALSMTFKADKNLFGANGFKNPYVVFTFGGKTTTVTNYTEQNGLYLFEIEDIAPNQSSDKVHAVLHASYNEQDYTASLDMSVADYCYKALEAYGPYDAYASLRTLLVDLLNYVSAVQTYSGYGTSHLANADLTGAQKAWGTATDPTIGDIFNKNQKVNESATASITSLGIVLDKNVCLRFKFHTDEALTGGYVRFTTSHGSSNVPFSEYERIDSNNYYVYFSELNSAQMRDYVDFTMYNASGVAISNTIRSSIESYVYRAGEAEKAVTKAMMKYGDSTKRYVDGL